MLCDRCGAERRPSGPCPRCGAPPPGSAGRPYGNRAQGGDAYRPGQQRGSGAGRSSARNQRRGDYQEIDLERALVPTPQNVAPINVGSALPAIPGLPQTEEEERALGIRRPVYIPVTDEHRKRRISSFRVLSGVLSLMVICIASCTGLAFLGKTKLETLVGPRISTSQQNPTPFINFTQVPGTPAATPGAAAKYVTSATTARNVDNNFAPVDITSKFTVNSMVYVVLSVRNVPKGTQHTLSVRWFLNTLDVQLPPSALIKKDIVQDSNAYFALQYPQPGLGMVKVYWDRPANDSDDSDTNPYLAQKLYFAIQPPVPTATPLPKATATTGGTPTGYSPPSTA